MKRSLWRKAMALTLVAAMTAGLTACGGGSDSVSADGTKRYFKADYLSDLPDSFNDTTSDIRFVGDTMYYGSSNEDYTKYGIYSYNLVSGENAKLYELTQSDGAGNNSWVSSYTVTDSGEVFLFITSNKMDESSVTEDYSNATLDDVLSYMEEQWGYGAEDAESDWNDYYAKDYTNEDGTVNYGRFLMAQNATFIQSSSLMKVDASGNVVFQQDVDLGDKADSVSCNGMAADKEGNIYLALNTWSNSDTSDSSSSDEYYTLVVDSDGNVKGKIPSDGYTSKLVTLADGTIAAVGYGDTGCELRPLDAASMKEQTDKAIQVPSETISVLDEKNLLITEGSSVYKYNLDTKEKEAYFSWMDCNISSSNVNSYGVLSDGRIAAYLQNWNSNGNQTEIALIKEVDASEVADTVNLTLACMWSGGGIEEQVIAFNKSQDKYHISVQSFGDGDEEYTDAVNNFNTAVTSDSNIDIILFNDYSQAINFVSKGLNVDLYEMIDKDADLSRDDFLPNILAACEYDGKLAILPQTFSLQTVIGKAEDVGTTPGWTVEDMKALLASKPEGTQLFFGMDRTTALSTLMSLGYNDFINWEDASCNFDSQEFIDVLEFANMFPDTFEYTDDMEDSTVLMSQGKQLLDTYYLSDFEQVQMYRTIFGGPTTFIGYPTSSGNGAMLSLNNILGISNNCKDMDGAWQFLRTLYLPKKSSDNDNNYSYGFSVRKDEFEKYCENAMKDDTNSGSTWGWGNFEVEIQPATQEDVDQVKDLVYNTTAVSGAVSDDITNIINEEAAAYFSGQKSAEDVAKIIQSRMQVYLSETK